MIRKKDSGCCCFFFLSSCSSSCCCLDVSRFAVLTMTWCKNRIIWRCWLKCLRSAFQQKVYANHVSMPRLIHAYKHSFLLVCVFFCSTRAPFLVLFSIIFLVVAALWICWDAASRIQTTTFAKLFFVWLFEMPLRLPHNWYCECSAHTKLMALLSRCFSRITSAFKINFRACFFHFSLVLFVLVVVFF